MSRAHKALLIGLLLILSVAMGSVQEWLKINVNFHLDAASRISGYDSMSVDDRRHAVDGMRLDAPYDYYYNHKPLSGLATLSIRGLSMLKWALTVAFVAIFLFMNAGVMRILSGSLQQVKWLVLLYLCFFALAFGLYMLGELVGGREHFYNIARKITGALQSPVPLMLTVPAWWLSAGMLEQKQN